MQKDVLGRTGPTQASKSTESMVMPIVPNRKCIAIVFTAISFSLVAVTFSFVDARSFADRANVHSQELTPNVIDIEVDQLAISSQRPVPTSPFAIPPEIQWLNDKRIRVRGYMYPTFKGDGITRFGLVGETTHAPVHMFSDKVRIHHVLQVVVRLGHKTKYNQEPIVVEGVLRIAPQWEQGDLVELYEIKDATITRTKPRAGFHSAVHWGC